MALLLNAFIRCWENLFLRIQEGGVHAPRPPPVPPPYLSVISFRQERQERGASKVSWQLRINIRVIFTYKSYHVTVILQLVCTSKCLAETAFFCKKTHHHHSSVTLAQYPLSQLCYYGFKASPQPLEIRKRGFYYIIQKKEDLKISK